MIEAALAGKGLCSLQDLYIPTMVMTTMAASVDAEGSKQEVAFRAKIHDAATPLLDLATVAPVLNAGFRAILEEAHNRRVLDPPYGRTAMPDPSKITQRDPILDTDIADDDSAAGTTDLFVVPEGRSPGLVADDDHALADESDEDSKLLEYKFDYGFNPLIFLGEFLRRNSPGAIRARNAKRDAIQGYLQQRAAKCLEREDDLLELRKLVSLRRSGIVHGPVAGDITDTGAVVWAKVFRPGTAGS